MTTKRKPRKPPKTTGDYGEESVIVRTSHGFQVRTPAFPEDVDYVRVVLVEGGEEYEYVYWNSDEWEESLDTMGAIMGAIKSVANGDRLKY